MWPLSAQGLMPGSTVCTLKQVLRPQIIFSKRLSLYGPNHARTLSLSGNVTDRYMVKKLTRTKWTDDNIEQLKIALAAGKTDRQCCELFPGIPENSVRIQRRKLGHYRRAPSADAVRVVELAAKGFILSQIREQMPHLTDNKIMCIARDRDISVRKFPVSRFDMPRPAAWTSEQEQKLTKALACGLTIEKLADLFPGRSPSAVDQKARALKLGSQKTSAQSIKRRWTPEEDKQLLDLYWKDITYAEIGSRLNRTFHGVARRLTNIDGRRKDPATTG